MRLIGLIGVILAGLTGCVSGTGPEPAAEYYVMRHLHTPAGERDPDLTDEGRRHALIVAERFGDQPLGAIYVTGYKRTRQTAEPLAQALGLPMITYEAADTAALVDRARGGPKPALIVGHSNTVPDIIEQLGGTRPEPLTHEDFGDIWRLGPDGSTTRSKVDQSAGE